MTAKLDPLPQTYFEDVDVGDELPGFSHRLSSIDLIAQVSGSQDFYAVHYDSEFARAGGHGEVFYNTGWTRAQLYRLLADLAGPDGWVRRLHFEMRRMILPGDTITVSGEISGKEQTDEGNAVEVELSISTDREGVTTPASGTVLLPSRA